MDLKIRDLKIPISSFLEKKKSKAPPMVRTDFPQEHGCTAGPGQTCTFLSAPISTTAAAQWVTSRAPLNWICVLLLRIQFFFKKDKAYEPNWPGENERPSCEEGISRDPWASCHTDQKEGTVVLVSMVGRTAGPTHWTFQIIHACRLEPWNKIFLLDFKQATKKGFTLTWRN